MIRFNPVSTPLSFVSHQHQSIMSPLHLRVTTSPFSSTFISSLPRAHDRDFIQWPQQGARKPRARPTHAPLQEASNSPNTLQQKHILPKQNETRIPKELQTTHSPPVQQQRHFSQPNTLKHSSVSSKAYQGHCTESPANPKITNSSFTTQSAVTSPASGRQYAMPWNPQHLKQPS